MPDIARILTIAGSDSGGGAGIEADLKTIQALGGYGMAAITSVTAQNSVDVLSIFDISPDVVSKQIDAVVSDFGVDAVKTGMLSNADIVRSVAESISRNNIEKLVVDPVMISKSGAALLQGDAQKALVTHLLPLTYILTPNVPEAEAISGRSIATEADLKFAAEAILAKGPHYVLMKGGHINSQDDAVDYLFDGETVHTFPGKRIHTKNTHGTGCTFSAAIATLLGQGLPAVEAVSEAKEYLTGAIAHALPLGHGHGPLDHGYRLRGTR